MKRFLYLFQVEDELPDNLRDAEGPESEVRFLAYRNPSTDPRQLFYPSSSWTQGRNRLFREFASGHWEYVIFGDADVQLERVGRGGARRRLSPWREFERFLLEYQPAVGTPAYDWHLSGRWDPKQDVQTLRFFDPVLNAFHREALHTLLPYYDLLDEECADYSGTIVAATAAELYPGHVLQYNRVRALNPVSQRRYSERLLTKGETLFLQSLQDPQVAERFRRQPEWSQLQHPDMGPARRKSESYARTEAELAAHFRLEHPLWSRKRELSAMPIDHPFYGPDRESERARRWRAHVLSAVGAPASRLRRAWVRTHALRASLGLVRSSRLYASVRWVLSLRHAARLAWWTWRDRQRRPNGMDLWRSWLRGDQRPISLPAGNAELARLLSAPLNQLRDGRLVLLDVGSGSGEALGCLRTYVARRMPIVSIGVDAEQTRGFSWYTGYVLGLVGSPLMALDLILRQYGLAAGPIHWARIAEGDPRESLDSLGERINDCLFLTLRIPIAEPPTMPVLQRPSLSDYRLLAESSAVGDGFRDVTFVNLRRMPAHLTIICP